MSFLRVWLNSNKSKEIKPFLRLKYSKQGHMIRGTEALSIFHLKYLYRDIFTDHHYFISTYTEMTRHLPDAIDAQHHLLVTNKVPKGSVGELIVFV